MVKQLKQRYNYKGRAYTLSELRKFIRFDGVGNIFGSLCVTTKNGISVKLVFVHNRNKKSECLYLLSTDCSLSATVSMPWSAIPPLYLPDISFWNGYAVTVMTRRPLRELVRMQHKILDTLK